MSNTENKNVGLPLSAEVWNVVIHLVQLAMLSGIDVSDYLRLIRVQQTSDATEFTLADGQMEMFQGQIQELMKKLESSTQLTPELSSMTNG